MSNQSVPIAPHGAVQGTLQLLFPPPNPYLKDCVGWIRDKAHEYAWSKQAEICAAIVEHPLVAVKACHGPGKSFIASRIGAWWIDVHPPGEAFVVSTAPTDKQVKAILWRELGRVHAKAKLAGRVNRDAEWVMDVMGQAELVAFGRKPADHNEHGFQGLHARYLLVIIDEACGVPKQLWMAVLSTLTNDNARCLAIGNPDDPDSYFAEVCDPSTDAGRAWKVIQIKLWGCPNFTGEHVPSIVRENTVTKSWLAKAELNYGRGTPMWQSKVEAEFPEVSQWSIFTPEIRRVAFMHTDLPGTERGNYAADVGRQGSSETTIYRNRGGQIRLFFADRGIATTVTQGVIIAEMSRHVGTSSITIDADGVGGGVADNVRDDPAGIAVHDWHGNAATTEPAKYTNLRSEAYWKFRLACQRGEVDLDPDDDVLEAQMSNIHYSMTGKGKIRVETKEEMQERGVPSPDRLDAVVMVWYAANSTISQEAIETLLKSHTGGDSGVSHSITGGLMGRRM